MMIVYYVNISNLTPEELTTLITALHDENKRYKFALEVLSTASMGNVEYARIYESQVKEIAKKALSGED